jgi:hypothetical protein
MKVDVWDEKFVVAAIIPEYCAALLVRRSTT